MIAIGDASQKTSNYGKGEVSQNIYFLTCWHTDVMMFSIFNKDGAVNINHYKNQYVQDGFIPVVHYIF